MAKAKTKPTKTSSEPEPKKVKKQTSTGLLGYFRNSWRELRLVRWPNRKSTWGMTLAVLLFSGFFMLVIIGLDAGFEFLFKEFVL